MASYLRPRRGKKATAVSQNVVLRRGEIFFEVPDTGVGTGNGKIKMGDGTTAYSALPYFMEPTQIDVATSTIAFTEATETDNAVLLSAITSGAQLKTLIGNIKKLLSNLNTSVTQLNNDLDDIVDGTTTVSKSTNSSTAVYTTNAGTSNYSKNSGTANYVGSAVSNKFTTIEYTKSNISGNKYENLYYSFDIEKSGYKPIGIVAIRFSGDSDWITNINIWAYWFTSTAASIRCTPISDSISGITLHMKILYVKTS